MIALPSQQQIAELASPKRVPFSMTGVLTQEMYNGNVSTEVPQKLCQNFSHLFMCCLLKGFAFF